MFKYIIKITIALCCIGLILLGILTIMIMMIYPKLPNMDSLRDYQPKLPLQIYSSDGALLGQFGDEHRIFVDFNHTPKMLVLAILAAEDERFYQHDGIDYIGIIRAIGLNVISGRKLSGASTITMQVARNFFLSSQKTYTRKFYETLLAYKIDHSLSKEQVLELYINQIYLGQRAYGFAEASLTYFGQPLDQLSIAQYAVLAGLPKAPSLYNPIVNKERSMTRQLYVLSRMLTNNFITLKQYKQAVEQPITVISNSKSNETSSGAYVAEMVRQLLYSRYGDDIYTNGYQVYTTINSKLQNYAYNALRTGLLNYDHKQGYRGAEKQLNIGDSDENDPITQRLIRNAFNDIPDFGDLQAGIVTRAQHNMLKVIIRNGNKYTFTGTDLNFVRPYLTNKKLLTRGSVIRLQKIDGRMQLSQLPDVEGGLVTLDPNNGDIKALVGGFDFTHNNFNHITQALRQPGSGFKSFIYSAALEHGFSANSIVEDNAICFSTGGLNGGQWCPRNDENQFYGDVTLRQALTFSLNVPTVKLLNQISPQVAIDYITKFGFNKSQFQPYLTLALGANEVTPMQMATAYSVFANGGYLVQPNLIQTIIDNNGQILVKKDNIDIHKNEPVIDPRNAFIINNILQDVARYGTGARAYKILQRADIAGKTGTTSDSKDVWFNGYTPNMVTVSWVGYDNPRSLGRNAYGANITLPIWLDFMQHALDGIPETIESMPAGITILPNATWQHNNEYIYTDAKEIALTNNNTVNESTASANNNSSMPSTNPTLPAQTNAVQGTPPPNESQVIPPPNAAQVIPPPNAAQVITPPNAAQVITPTHESQVITPPNATQVITPTHESQVIPPPNVAQVITPTHESQVITPPNVTQVIPPTHESQVIPPPNVAQVITPTHESQVITATNESVTINNNVSLSKP